MHSWHKWFPVFTSVSQFSLSVVSNILQFQELQCFRHSVYHQLPEFMQTRVVHDWSDLAAAAACPLSQWRHLTISPSVIPFSSCPQSFPASGTFQMSQLFTSGGQSIGVSASATVLPMNIQDWFPLGWTGWISLQSKGLSRVFPNTTVRKHQFLSTQLSL